MSKKFTFVLAGPAIPQADELIDGLARREVLFAEAGIALPAATQAESWKAGVEIRRTHKAEGLRRKDVEGSWTRLVRLADKTRSDALIACPGLAGADDDQAALALDALAGNFTHVVLTFAASDDADTVEATVAPWAALVKPHRLHVVRLAADEQLDDLLTRIVDLAAEARTVDLERRIAKLAKKRAKLEKRLSQVSSATKAA